MNINSIRNFSIIAHIDHGKSTLADRMLEVTGTIEKRKMKAQVLDSMELERERGITIKMQPVRMEHILDGQKYILNLIDTPGHIDFSYEVSRALKAVEGSILLIDATQGVQAQTLTTLQMARDSGLIIIPVLSKIDSPLALVDEVKMEVAVLLNIDPDTILLVSGKTGEGVSKLLDEIVKRIPPPDHPKEIIKTDGARALVFDFKYDNHRGVIVYVRVVDGEFKKGESLLFAVSSERFICLEVGTFSPEEEMKDQIGTGEIGYIVTGIKKPGIASVGDTITYAKKPALALPGYMNPKPVVWASVYPESQDDFPNLKQALSRLRLSDSSFSYEEESSGSLGRGFRCGFLGMLHLEIIVERLNREFSLELVVTMPSITYKVILRNGKEETIYSPHLFPDDGTTLKIFEPWVNVKIITPSIYTSFLMPFLYEHEATIKGTDNFGDNRSTIDLEMPLRELMRNFFDDMKSLTSGYASISYEIGEYRPADVVRMDIILANEVMPAFCRVVSRRRVEDEAKYQVEKLQKIIPRQQFAFKIQAKALGRIISSEAVSAFRKDVLMHGSKVVGGGDVSRKKKLLEKQKKGKKRMQSSAKINISHEVFLKMMRSSNDK
ncbi:MAG: GTP-binding protein LepA [Candidatus Nomurabacteria bacterium GW2011_GWF2_35_66]|uniref:Elongation factor 4 n=1 Tax=Candidatus Nomurabacteria bacterium GW2011_GWE1_35_16 TaxID=1618761 RepID=A0A0G0BPY1_9BACT|nr:MAG: GTP-binding protein LepA [Candidatus Nomurabacteria bacterium GW2011_GWF1_34_20]KKP62884.1 MAG: GTP-binding protein LepA [Candidatus Nomurabacteria bacterium GW2011_GWE2_34_25]KKP65701.1 MAG: GTP-binding protein LepA [Candidatus Nomurabacteria bacterium GW2011_GWE1_35_16]KKP82818.1 MAG: GTP-binding protein LepA [Candidatus Nomurabacteria bacterium GW2011_GWF2_35_66]HAE36710.1 elongation factor 4 [Candidatus Nomurabacteria bacterium]